MAYGRAHSTHKSTTRAKAQTKARRQHRTAKYGTVAKTASKNR